MEDWIKLVEESLKVEKEIYQHLLYEMGFIVDGFKDCRTLYETNAYFTLTVLEKDEERAYMSLPLPIIVEIVDTYKEIAKPYKHLSGYTLIMNSKISDEDMGKMFDESMRFWKDLEDKFKILS